MAQILKLVFLLIISQVALGQAPSNYTNINGRYRWIAGMFDSTFSLPKGTTPSLRTGGSSNPGALFYNTSDSSVYSYTGTQWIKLRGSINPSDTTNKYVTQVYKKNGSDSVFYVKGGVHTWAFNDSTGSAGGGGGGKIYYLNGGVSMGTFGGFTMYELGDTAVIATAANFTRATTGNIANFITDVGKPGLLQIPAGVWTVDAWLSETGGGSNHAEIYAAVEKWNGSTITTIATSPIEQITEGSSPNLYTWSVSIPTTTLAVTDRIIIQFYIQNTNGKTVTLYTQNGYVGEVHTTFTTGIGAINGLTAPAQYLVTGTSGTDFNISSATATHTFNLPTASATNRGALSTTDWSTFNNKVGGSGTTNYVAKFTASGTIGNSQIFDAGAAVGINTSTPSIDYNLDVNGQIRGTNIDGASISSRIPSLGITMAAISRTGNLSTSNGILVLRNSASGILQPASLYVDRTWTLPDKDGTVAMTSDLTGGTVTSVATNTNTGITGGTITTSGTIAADTLLLSTRKWRQKGIDSVQGNLTSGLALKVNISDTASMLSPYLRSNVASATYVPQTRTITINGTSQDLSANRTYNVGTVTSVATSTGTGITGGTITSTGTIAADTLLLSTRAWRQKGVDSVAALANSKISGTGTSNYVSKFTGSTTLANSLIYDDGTVMTFSPTGFEQMRITSTGLGIGTSSPAFKLDVSYTAAAGDIIHIAGANNVNGYIGAHALNNGGLYINSNQANQDLRFRTQGTDRMILDASGNLGLGVSPSAWYSSGFSAFQMNGGGYAVLSTTGSAYHANNAYFDATTVNWKYYATETATRYDQRLGQHIWYTAPSGTAGNAISFTQAMTLDALGRLSLSAASPTIEINPSTTTNNALYRATNTGGTVYIGLDNSVGGLSSAYALNLYHTGAYPIIFSTNGSEKMRITSGGNVVIGNTVASNVGLTIYGSNAATIYQTANTGTGAGNGFYVGHTGDISYLWNYNNYPTVFATNNTERMRITSGGTLQLNTQSTYGSMTYEPSITYTKTGQTGVGGIYFGNSFNSNNNVAMQLRVSNDGTQVQAMTITSSGNVEFSGSIKTAAPSGGTAKPYKWGEAGVAIGGSDGYAVKVEIDGTLYYLMTGYLPEPEPEAASGPTTGYKTQFEQPVIKIKSDNQKIKDLEKEIAELKELIKSKIK